MKKLFTSFVMVAIYYTVFAQSPQKMSYQCVVRNSVGTLVANQSVGIKISILQGSPSGSIAYQEIFNPNPSTNANGLVSLEIGSGIPLTGTLQAINWTAGPYFLKTETDPAGGTNYTISGTSQLLSVPYALHAGTVASYTETDPVFTSHPANTISGSNITNWNAAYGWGNHSSAGYVPGARSLTINGTALDLSANRTWSVGTVTSVGLSLPDIFSLSGSPVTASGTITATMVFQMPGQIFASPTGMIGRPDFRALVTTDIPGLDWSKITSGKPTTLAGYGITDAVNATTSQTANSVFASPNGTAGAPTFRALVTADIPNLDWSKITSGKPTTLAGYGITDAVNTAGNQTIAGNKTFTGKTTVPTPINPTDAATKAYVDALLERIEMLEVIASKLSDVDGNMYSVIRIGDQYWMAQNLRVARFKNGTPIPLVSDNTAWANLTTPGYCWYNNDEDAYKITYGALYNWYTINNGNLCPTGWHVPTINDWTTLTTYLGGEGSGGKLKETGTVHWESTNIGATNETGFTALPGGMRIIDGSYHAFRYTGFWWEITGRYCGLRYDDSRVNWNGPGSEKIGISVRCLRDL